MLRHKHSYGQVKIALCTITKLQNQMDFVIEITGTAYRDLLPQYVYLFASHLYP